MRPRFSKTLNIPVPATWDDIVNDIAGREAKTASTVTRELILAGFRSRGIDPFVRHADAPAPEAA